MILLYLLILSFVINLIFFIAAYFTQSDKFTDITYALSFIILAGVAFYHIKHRPTFNLVLSLLVMIWAIRIGGFLLYRVLKKGRDKRFDGRRENFAGLSI